MSTLKQAIDQELSESIELAEGQLASERLGGNVVKAEFWKGELAALRRMQAVVANASPATKITAIHGGGDWADASAEYLILPDGMDIEAELRALDKWYKDVYLPAFRGGQNMKYQSAVDWLKARGAVEPTSEQLVVVNT
jgi:hypothetical protein